MRYDDPEVRLAVTRLAVFKAMQSPLGALYYAANGTPGVNDFTEVSVENNVSMLAGLRLLRQVLQAACDPDQLIPLVDDISNGILQFLRDGAYDANDGVFIQGGVIVAGRLLPSPDFAVDVQTWGLTVLGQAQVDEWLGQGAAARIWQRTKARAGALAADGRLQGVGYTDGHVIVSGEWTYGAINMCRTLAAQYKALGQDQVAAELSADAESMIAGLEQLRTSVPDGTVAVLYANQRYRIPFSGGWWANPVPSTASTAWSLMIDMRVNPFEFGAQAPDDVPLDPTGTRVLLPEAPAGAPVAQA